MDDTREIDTMDDGPETERWRSIIEQLTRDGEHLEVAVNVADLAVRTQLDRVAAAMFAAPR